MAAAAQHCADPVFVPPCPWARTGPGARPQVSLQIPRLCAAPRPAPSVAAAETSSSSVTSSLLSLRSSHRDTKRIKEGEGKE